MEKFSHGRCDKLLQHEHSHPTSGHPATDYVSRFYSGARVDGLTVRVYADSELTETYQGRLDGLTSMKVHEANSNRLRVSERRYFSIRRYSLRCQLRAPN